MRLVAAAVLGVAACAPADDAPVASAGLCPEGRSRAPLAAADRKIAGEAAPYAGDGTLRGRDAELARSQRLRREVAWRTAGKVLAEVELAEGLPGAAGLPARVPAWHTWYDHDDLRRVFHHLYAGLAPAEREARRRFDAAELDAAFEWNTRAVEELPNWPPERYAEHLAAIDSSLEIAGVGGIARARYSPAAGRHLLASYPEVLACRDGGPPPAHADGPRRAEAVARVEVMLDACEARRVGAYAVAAGETLYVALETRSGDAADLRVGGGHPRCAGARCEVAGPATAEVVVAAGAAPTEAAVVVTRERAQPPWAACLDGAFGLDAAVVKADFRRSDLEMTLPVYATGGDALAARMQGDVSWEQDDGQADPSAREIYTLTTSGGATYRLAALHLMTKELDHWLWVTLWWSPEPDEDFGADRPAELDGVWRNYKMCAVTAFTEGDPQPGGGFELDHPSLAAALAAVHAGEGGPSWCSNPYLERGHGNAGSSCVGCHQHGGTDLQPEDILALPAFGRTERRNNFPADYSWGTTSGDELAQLFADEEAYWAGAPRGRLTSGETSRP